MSPIANVTITNTANSPLNVGETGEFTITLENKGPNTATNVMYLILIFNWMECNSINRHMEQYKQRMDYKHTK